MARFAFPLLIFFALGGCASQLAPNVEIVEQVAYGTTVRGSSGAKGVIFYSPGSYTRGLTWIKPEHNHVPDYLLTLNQAGWDIIRLNINQFDQRGDLRVYIARKLREIASDAKSKGYSAVIMAGQSFGAWNTFYAAMEDNDFDAIIASVPATYGDGLNKRENARLLYDMLSVIKVEKVSIFYFKGDTFSPGDCGPRSRELLESKVQSFILLNEPAGFDGHGAAWTRFFDFAYSDCLTDFLDQEAFGEVVCQPPFPTSSDYRWMSKKADLRGTAATKVGGNEIHALFSKDVKVKNSSGVVSHWTPIKPNKYSYETVSGTNMGQVRSGVWAINDDRISIDFDGPSGLEYYDVFKWDDTTFFLIDKEDRISAIFSPFN